MLSSCHVSIKLVISGFNQIYSVDINKSLSFLGHRVRRDEDHIINNIRQFRVGGKIKRGRPKTHGSAP